MIDKMYFVYGHPLYRCDPDWCFIYTFIGWMFESWILNAKNEWKTLCSFNQFDTVDIVGKLDMYRIHKSDEPINRQEIQ